ncbi:MAG: transcriptional regulator [Rhodovulum sulfidophilum]|uniref:Transcriptional regulator n=1 Tax=Rhodovulum sulfidophilum TaxID=35806 RepID=A0A2W5N4V5_RHOSU|nr:MAG: transcriptional regulator [Rhodovulum sulfidophilum]
MVPRSIGDRLRSARLARKMTLRQVAEGAGLSIGFISQAERDIASPSLSSLRRIAAVLGVSPQAVLPEVRAASELSRHRDRPICRVYPGAGIGYERLTTTFPGSRLSGVIMHERPGHRLEAERHGGEEVFYVLEGAVTVEIDGVPLILEAGDSLHFSSQRLHASWNHTERPTVILHFCTMDVFGDQLADGATLPAIHAGYPSPPLEAERFE